MAEAKKIIKKLLLNWEASCNDESYFDASKHFQPAMCVFLSEYMLAGSYLQRSIFESYFDLKIGTHEDMVKGRGNLQIFWHKRARPQLLSYRGQMNVELDAVFGAWDGRLEEFQEMTLED